MPSPENSKRLTKKGRKGKKKVKKQRYTPEPWWNYLEVIHGPSAYGDIAECKRMTHLGEAEANAKRIVACVNYCAGITTDDLERRMALRKRKEEE